MTLFQSLHILPDLRRFRIVGGGRELSLQRRGVFPDKDGFALFSLPRRTPAQSSGFVTNRLLNHVNFGDVRRTACSSGAHAPNGGGITKRLVKSRSGFPCC